jgi:hypothetical protein
VNLAQGIRERAIVLWRTTSIRCLTRRKRSPPSSSNDIRRRVREFRVSSDAFAELATGRAFVHTTLGPPLALCQVTPVALPTRPG